MAIFLLIYVLFIIVWLAWSATITYVLLKYHYPDNIWPTRLGIYWAVSAVFLVVSIVFIAKADWVSVPGFIASMGV